MKFKSLCRGCNGTGKLISTSTTTLAAESTSSVGEGHALGRSQSKRANSRLLHSARTALADIIELCHLITPVSASAEPSIRDFVVFLKTAAYCLTVGLRSIHDGFTECDLEPFAIQILMCPERLLSDNIGQPVNQRWDSIPNVGGLTSHDSVQSFNRTAEIDI